MAMTALNTQAVQGQQMGGAPNMQPQPASADILMRKRKKKSEPKHEAPQVPSGPPTADILMRRKK